MHMRVNLVRKLNLLLPPSSLLTVYKCFIRPHLDYRHAIYNQPYLPYLTNKIECDFAIRNAIRGTSDNQLCLELGFESSKDRRWVRQLCHQYKVVSTEQRTDLFDLIPPFQESLQNKGCIYELFCQTVSFKNYLILHAVKK